jgi:hypothetical protein
VLPGESRYEYESLLKGLSEALKPVKRLEELLVEKLATIEWRRRRVLQAEGAEIRQGSEFLEWDQRNQHRHESEIVKRTLVREFKRFSDVAGLITEIQNPKVLEYCVELLLGLQQRIKSRGLDLTADDTTLQSIYGSRENVYGTFRKQYLGWFNTSQASEEERQRNGYATPERCKEKVLSEIDAEIQRLRDYRDEWDRNESERMKLEILRHRVPESPRLDLLMRYEASLERAFDRTLNQLERAQRLRLGQSQAPQIDVNVTT